MAGSPACTVVKHVRAWFAVCRWGTYGEPWLNIESAFMACGRATGIHRRSTNPDALYPLPGKPLIRPAWRYPMRIAMISRGETFEKSWWRSWGGGGEGSLGRTLSFASSRLSRFRGRVFNPPPPPPQTCD